MKSYILLSLLSCFFFRTPLQSIDAGVDILEVVALVTVAHEAVAVLEVVVLAEVVLNGSSSRSSYRSGGSYQV